MIDISKTPILKYFLFSDLYFAEGLEMAIIGFLIPMYLLDNNYSISLITIVSGIAIIPWVIKFVWGGIVDYFSDLGRKRFIILGGSLAIISLFVLSVIDPVVALVPFSIFLFLSHCGVAFLDVSADAWAIEISKKEERGKINSAMMSGNLIGIFIGSSLFAFISKTINYNFAFIIAGLCIFLLIIYPLLVKENKIRIKHEKIGIILINEFKKLTTILVVFFGFLLVINNGLHLYVIPLFERTVLKLDITQIGVLTIMGLIWVVPGALIGGFLADKWGRKKTLYLFIVIGLVFSALLIFMKSWEDLYLYGIVMFSYSGLITAFAALAMDVTNPRVGATQFSIIMSISNAGEWIAASMSGTLIAILGFHRVFLYSALAFGPALLVLYYIRLKKVDNK